MVSAQAMSTQYEHMFQWKCLSKEWMGRHCPHLLLIFYFLFFSLVAALSIWMSPKRVGSTPLPFIDSLFSAVSAFTETGLTNVEMHTLSILDQLSILLLMAFGSPVFTSFLCILFKRACPNVNYRDSALRGVHRDLRSNPKLVRSASMPTLTSSVSKFTPIAQMLSHHVSENIITQQDITITSLKVNRRKYRSQKVDQYVQNAAHKVLMYIILCYNVACITLGSVALQICLTLSPHATEVLRKNNINSLFFSIFSCVSSFGNCGFMLLDSNLVPLRRSSLFLICLNVLMLLGNTMYAPTLHFIIWIIYKTSTGKGKRIYRYLLETPQHFSHLFPPKETRLLVMSVLFINGLQVICMLGLDWNSKAFQGIGSGYKVVDALFQSITTRTSGMNVMDLALLSAPTLFVILIMMYLEPYHINVFTKKCVKPSTSEENQDMQADILPTHAYFLIMAMFFIYVFEKNNIELDPINFSLFNIVFEIISAYGNVGLSIGYKCAWRVVSFGACIDPPYCNSRAWSPMGKIMLIFVMFLGKHRGFHKDVM